MSSIFLKSPVIEDETEEITAYMKKPRRLMTYDPFLEQSIGCRPRANSEDWEICYLITKQKLLKYRHGVITETNLDIHPETPALFRDPLTLDIRRTRFAEAAIERVNEMLDLILRQHELLEIRYRVLLAAFNERQSSVEEHTKPIGHEKTS